MKHSTSANFMMQEKVYVQQETNLCKHLQGRTERLKIN